MRESMWYLAFWVWGTLLNVVISSFIYFLQMSWFQFALWPSKIALSIYVAHLLTHSCIEGLLGSAHF